MLRIFNTKYFHMRITDDKNKINKSIKSYMYK